MDIPTANERLEAQEKAKIIPSKDEVERIERVINKALADKDKSEVEIDYLSKEAAAYYESRGYHVSGISGPDPGYVISWGRRYPNPAKNTGWDL